MPVHHDNGSTRSMAGSGLVSVGVCVCVPVLHAVSSKAAVKREIMCFMLFYGIMVLSLCCGAAHNMSLMSMLLSSLSPSRRAMNCCQNRSCSGVGCCRKSSVPCRSMQSATSFTVSVLMSCPGT